MTRTSAHILGRWLGTLLLALGLSSCQDSTPPPTAGRSATTALRTPTDAAPACVPGATQIEVSAAGQRGTIQLPDGALQFTRADGSPLPLRPEDLRLAQAEDGSAQAWLGYGAHLIPITEPACVQALRPVIGVPDEAALQRSEDWAEAIREAHAAGDQAGMVQLLQEASAARLDWAMAALGLSLLRGEGVTADRAAAIQWFQQAARQSHPEALYQLGGLYAQGAAGAEGEARILHLLGIARALGHAKATSMLQAIGH